MIAIDLAAGVFAMIVGLLVTSCVITCIMAQRTLEQCREVLRSAVDCMMRVEGKQKEEYHHEGTD